jgi:uncharacterized membrane protein YdjX (TVP38/TMEM64 family)
MPSDAAPPLPRRFLVVKLALLAVGLLVLAVLILRGLDWRALVDGGMTMIRDAGPWVFFISMAVLPAVGAPLTFFTLPAGEAFGAQMGIGGVIVVTLAMITLNLALAYWIARYALRPLLTRLLKRYGYTIPRVTPENALSVALVVRLTPGAPFVVQNFILGVAETPFRLFMIVSWLAVAPWAAGAIVLGKGIFAGDFQVVAIGMGVIVIAVVAVQWLRRKYFRRAD